MSGKTKIGLVVAGLLAVALIIVRVQGCQGGKPVAKLPKAVPFVCESCGYQFGVPWKAPFVPPLVCPKCGKRTAVQAHLREPANGGDPQIFWYTKYTDEQVRRMADYVKGATPKELAMISPSLWLGEPPLVKVAGSNAWLAAQDMPRGRDLNTFLEGKIKSNREIYPDDPEKWPVIPVEKLRQQ